MSLRSLATQPRSLFSFLFSALASVALGADRPNPDPFVGDYSGEIHPLGVYEGKGKPKDDKDFTPKNCGSCHVEAKVQRNAAGYSLMMIIDHGQDKNGKPRKDRLTLTAKGAGKPLTFTGDAYKVTLADGETTRGWIKQMASEVKLKRTTAPATIAAGSPSAAAAPGEPPPGGADAGRPRPRR